MAGGGLCACIREPKTGNLQSPRAVQGASGCSFIAGGLAAQTEQALANASVAATAVLC